MPLNNIVQITDTHICEPGELLYGKVDTAQHLRDAVAAINRMRPVPDMVLVTGDLVDNATTTSYANFIDCIAPLSSPVRVMPGNHDKPKMMVDIFRNTEMFPVSSPPYQYGFDSGKIHIIMANSHKSGSGLPEFGEDRLDNLAKLIKVTTRPTLLAIHHPPLMTGISFIDMSGHEWFNGINNLVNSNPHIQLIICGHGHSELMGRIGNTPVYMSASQAHQLSCVRGNDVAPIFIASPAPPALHSWTYDGGFVSGPVAWPADAEDQRIDKLAGMDWSALKEQMKKDGS